MTVGDREGKRLTMKAAALVLAAGVSALTLPVIAIEYFTPPGTPPVNAVAACVASQFVKSGFVASSVSSFRFNGTVIGFQPNFGRIVIGINSGRPLRIAMDLPAQSRLSTLEPLMRSMEVNCGSRRAALADRRPKLG